MDVALMRKTVDLRALLGSLDNVVVAFSGGVDSALLTDVSHDVLGSASLAVTAVSPSLARRELRAAEELAARYGWQHLVVTTNELARESYARNAPDRCYWCKTELFDVLRPLALDRSAQILVGTNVDDLGDHRPGLRAAGESGVLSPLAAAGFTKGDVRKLSAERGLPTSEKPASPCLASRFAYGVRVTEEGLQRIDLAEEHLRALGFEVLRVRDHGDLARIEVPVDEVAAVAERRAEIVGGLVALGFRYVTLDLAGFRSGSMNEVLLAPGFGAPEA